MRNKTCFRCSRWWLLWSLVAGWAATSSAHAEDGTPPLRFQNIAQQAGRGLNYARQPSATFADYQAILQASVNEPLSFQDIPNLPYNTYGQPGIALFDYDKDGDLDIYVTNGPGAPNRLFSNQLEETGTLRFIDVASQAGVAATDQDGMGVCYGDTDNDGDDDLLVLGRDEPNRFFVNNGDGTFVVAANHGLGETQWSSPSCAMGDVNQDGLLDITVVNAYSHDNLLACVVFPFALNQPNQLYLNQGNNTFIDVSAESGILDLAELPEGAQGITWAVSMLDIDADGDTDIVMGDDRCAIPTRFEDPQNGVDRAFIHIMKNDGHGHFTDEVIESAPDRTGSWMGLGFGDLNCDGRMDMFGSNFGDYHGTTLGDTDYVLGGQASAWFLQDNQGVFFDPGVGDLVSTAFGWGNAVMDYDNDGDLDIIYGGGIDDAFIVLSDNPGIVLRNDNCTANFSYDLDAIVTDDSRRMVQALAVGDLDKNGFVDIVNASTLDIPDDVPLVPSPAQWASPLDPFAASVPVLEFTPAGFVWTGVSFAPGSLAVEMNNGANRHGWVSVTVLGSKGLTQEGKVNRSGIGALVSVRRQNGQTVTQAVLGGASFASQHSLDLTFGLGDETTATVEVLWPGGVRNRLYGVKAKERITFPEIPCSFDDPTLNRRDYRRCVKRALRELREEGQLSRRQSLRYYASAVRAYLRP